MCGRKKGEWIGEGGSTYSKDLDLVSLFQMLSECFDECLGGHVLDGVTVLVNEGEVLLQDLVSQPTRRRGEHLLPYLARLLDLLNNNTPTRLVSLTLHLPSIKLKPKSAFHF